MEKSSVKFRTPSRASAKSGASSDLNESLNTTRHRFLTAPEVPISDAEARKRELLEKQKEMERKGKKKKKKGKQLKVALEDEDIDGKRVQELQERHMRAMDDLTKLRNHYYHEYKDMLDAKVIQQRRDIQKKSEELKRKIELKKLQEIEASHHVKKRLSKSVGNVDNTFLKNLPKSKMYKIMALQSKLMQEGRFTCIEDVEKFWEKVSDPEIYYQMFESGGVVGEINDDDNDDAKSQGSAGSDGTADKVSLVGTLHHLDRVDGGPSLFSIEEDNEPSRRSSTKRASLLSTGQRSSITQQRQTKSYRKPVHPKVAEMEQKYPRVEWPEMSALYMDLDPPKEDPEVVAVKYNFKKRSKERAAEKRRLRKMYEMSLSHQASTQRLIDKNEDFSNVMDSLYISDVGGMLCNSEQQQEQQPLALDYTPYNYPSFSPALPLPPTTSHRSNSLTPALQEIAKLLGETIPEEREEDVLESHGSASTRWKKSSKSKHPHDRESRSSSRESSSAGSNRSRTRRERQLEPIISGKPSTLAVPLTMDTIMHNKATVVKDVTCLSTLWTNYARDLPTVR